MLRTCLCIVLLAVAVSALKSCPVINAQIEGSSVSASWTGLDRKEVLTVEWAVAQGNFDDSIQQVCLPFAPIRSLPSILPWTKVSNKKLTTHSINNMELDAEQSTYVILRVSNREGEMSWVVSNELQTIQPQTSTKSETHTFNVRDHEEAPSAPNKCYFAPTCQVDIDNICSAPNARERLFEAYGPAKWSNAIGADSIYFN